MKGHPLDLTGERFDRLLVIGQAGTSDGGRLWRCRCDCGNEIVKATTALRRKSRQFGGCRSCEPYSRASVHTRHGENVGAGEKRARTHIYRVWKGIRDRCKNPGATSYRYYGAIGITRCDAWSDFAVFRDWAAANGYEEGLSIDRINPFGNYEPANCRWCTRSENSRGTRRKTWKQGVA